MRAAAWVLLVALLGAACAGTSSDSPGDAGGGGGAAASCVGPYVDDQPPGGRYGVPPPTVAPGGSVTLYGHWYTSTCDDTGQDEPDVPRPDVTLTVTWADGRRTELGPYAPGGADVGFAAVLVVPLGVPAGTVSVTDGRGGPGYTFTVGR